MFKLLSKIQETADNTEALAQAETVLDEATQALVEECCDMFADITVDPDPEGDETNGPSEEEKADQEVVDKAILAQGEKYYLQHGWSNGGREALERYSAAYQRVYGREYNPCVC